MAKCVTSSPCESRCTERWSSGFAGRRRRSRFIFAWSPAKFGNRSLALRRPAKKSSVIKWRHSLDVFMTNKDRPIGVFDSGIGGLTGLHQIIETPPQEKTGYLRDTARAPHRTKTLQNA